MPNQYFGLSTDEKPLDVVRGSIYMEIDTCNFYYFNGYTWEEMPCHWDGTANVSGDFSTATVTSINNTSATISCIIPYASDDPEESALRGDMHFDIGTMTTSALLYKGKCIMYMPSDGHTITISGNIEDDGDGYYIITGDCTITISYTVE